MEAVNRRSWNSSPEKKSWAKTMYKNCSTWLTNLINKEHRKLASKEEKKWMWSTHFLFISDFNNLVSLQNAVAFSLKRHRVFLKDGDVLKKRRGVSTKTSGRFKKTLGMFRNSLMTAPFYSEKIKVRFSSSWLSVYTKDADLQSISMTSRGKNGCHWLSEKCMTTNDNENTGLLSE